MHIKIYTLNINLMSKDFKFINNNTNTLFIIFNSNNYNSNKFEFENYLNNFFEDKNHQSFLY